ncbi:hypothetical protein PO878_10985 [Iamia majanohamensis]|uniref:Uncharacterized protein n=1 Tax=Iamia majanohamensis TaxID=467976 RepID=A0AAE9Y668_9ACTN|nr:hypothetical protein [Iamia majanohamensis]WCO65023.1 hypothetical protein PO878_10985 [Iamia majanohamensis]
MRLWWEYERATKRRRAMAWSKGLRALLAEVEEVIDEDIVHEGDKEPVLVLVQSSA